MIGDTPQPGETPRSEGDPWSFGDPDAAWWRGETDRPAPDSPGGRPRHPRRRAPQHQPMQHQPMQHQPAAGGTGTLLPPEARPYTGEAAEAHAAGTRDAAGELTRTVTGPPPPAALQPVEPPVVERDHDRADPHRYDPLRPRGGYRAQVATGSVAADNQTAERRPQAPEAPVSALEVTIAAPETAVPAREETDAAGPGDKAGPTDKAVEAEQAVEAEPIFEAGPIFQAPELPDEPDVMILPEPSPRNRPTVPIERGPVPGQPRHAAGRPTEPLPPLTGVPATDARLEKLENSPFWQDRPEEALEPAALDRPSHTAIRTHRGRPPAGRLRLSAHVALIALGLLAAFFGWVSAEPFWLAAGHGDRGVATVSRCIGSGVTQRCVGTFESADGRYRVGRVTLLGVEPSERTPGASAPAKMVSPDSRQTYLGETGTLLHVRWMLGFALVLVCGLAVSGVTGARRLETARARRVAVLLSMAGPFALFAGFLIAAY